MNFIEVTYRIMGERLVIETEMTQTYMALWSLHKNALLLLEDESWLLLLCQGNVSDPQKTDRS